MLLTLTGRAFNFSVMLDEPELLTIDLCVFVMKEKICYL